jgi:hypothetical protein
MGLITTYNNSLKSLAKSAGAVLYLDARKATGNSLPVNSPLTTPWLDLSGNENNATPTNFAGTTASGVDTSDPLRPFWVLDGTDDFFSLVNTASVDVTAAPLAVFATIKLPLDFSAYGYVLCKNTSSSADTQYGLNIQTNGVANVLLEGSAVGFGVALSKNAWSNVGFIWDGTGVRRYTNLVLGGNIGSYSGKLTSLPNLRIGRREASGGHLRASIATVSVYTGSKATETSILKAERSISKAYMGG